MPALHSTSSVALPICHPTWLHHHRLSSPSLPPPPSSLVIFPASPPSILPRLLWSLPCAKSSAASALDTKAENRMSDEFVEVELKVRGYELDQYGVVNNAVYANYCQLGGEEVFDRLGFEFNEVARTGQALAVSDLSIKYLAPLRSGDRFVVKVRVSSISAARCYVDHFIFKLPNLQPVVEAKATVVFLDNNYRPVRFPTWMRSAIAQLFSNEGTS